MKPPRRSFLTSPRWPSRHAVALANTGKVDDSPPVFAKAYRLDPILRKLPPRLSKVGLLPEDPKVIERIVAAK